MLNHQLKCIKLGADSEFNETIKHLIKKIETKLATTESKLNA